MTCVDVRDNLSAYLDGELEREQAAAVESHLAGCEGCRAELESLRRVTETLHALPHRAAPAEIEREVVGQIERDALLTRPALPRRRRFALPIFAGAALAAALLVAVGLYIRYSGVQREVGPVVSMTEKAPADARERYDDVATRRLDKHGNLDLPKESAAPDGVPTLEDSTRAEKPYGGDNLAWNKWNKTTAPSAPAAPAPALMPETETKLAEVPAEGLTERATEEAAGLAAAEPAPARPEVLELKLAATDFTVERARITTLAESLNIRSVNAARLALDVDRAEAQRYTRAEPEKRVAAAETTAGPPGVKEDNRVREALDKVAQHARTDDEYEATVARLLDIVERAEAQEAASPVIVLAVPEDKLGPFVAKLAAHQEEGEGLKVTSVAPAAPRAQPVAKKESVVDKAKEPPAKPADPLDEFMKALEKAAAEDAERERMARDTAGREGEPGRIGRTHIGDARGGTGSGEKAEKDVRGNAPPMRPVPAAPTRELEPKKGLAGEKPAHVIYLQILLTRPVSTAK